MFFIDAITNTLKQTEPQTEGCYYVKSPGALTDLAIAINKFVRHGFDYVIFDSISNMLIYQEKAPVAKFLANIITNIRAGKTKAVFYALSVKKHEDVIGEAGMFVDKVIDLGK